MAVYNTLKYITCSPCDLQQVTVNEAKEAHAKRQNVPLRFGATHPFVHNIDIDTTIYVHDHVQLHTIDTNECLSTDSVQIIYMYMCYCNVGLCCLVFVFVCLCG